MTIHSNKELRNHMREKHVPLWAIALELGIHEDTLHRHLRTELSQKEKERIIAIVDRLVEKEEKGEI